MAQQTEPVRRTVAVKPIKSGGDTHAVLARFEAERQALALMDHPNIAKVLDGGTTESGRPFFVMELVKGVAITKFCDARKLTPRQRLELFVPVCQAIQHAHQKGIIHRDVKPSNVLVALYDDRPVPKVIDFGVAKATGPQLTEQTLVTGFGALVGTLEYMSPEQATLNNLDIDTRSDSYSLGVLLYELLAGSPPLPTKELEKAGFLELLRVIRDEEPLKPSTKVSTAKALPTLAANRNTEPAKLSRLLRGEIDWIVMKSLEKDRARRYETANGFAVDIQRYLTDEPVLAGPPSALYRLRKFGRRHKAGLLTMAAAALMLFLAGTGTGWVWWDWSAQRTATEQTVSILLAKADDKRSRAERLPMTDEAEAKAQRLEWQNAEAALAEADAALKTGAATDGVRQHVAEAREQIERGKSQAQRKEKLFHDLDEARLASAAVVENDFDYAGAAAMYQAAFAVYGLEVRPGDTEKLARRIRAEDSGVRAALLVALDNWTIAASNARTTPSVAELLVLTAAADDDSWRQRLRQAAVAHDGVALCAVVGTLAAVVNEGMMAAMLRDLSVEARNMSLPASSVELLARRLNGIGERAEAVALLRWARKDQPADFWIHFHLGTYLAQVRERTSPLDLEESVGCLRAALALRPRAAAAHNNLGNALTDKKPLDDAIDEFNKAIAIDPKFASAHVNLGIALARNKQLVEAIDEFNKAIAIDPKFASAHNNLGNALLLKKQLVEAMDEFNKAIAINPKLAAAHNNLGLALVLKEQLDQAIDEFNKAIAIDPELVMAHGALGLALLSKGRFAEAKTSTQQALILLPDNHPQRVIVLRQLQQCEALLTLEAKLPAILEGRAEPADVPNLMDLARFGTQWKQQFVKVASLFERCFARHPDWAADSQFRPRYFAAATAAMAARGEGEGANLLKDANRRHLREQARLWLRAELEAWTAVQKLPVPKEREMLQQPVQYWREDGWLSGVRDRDALGKLPEEEQKAWQKLWTDVDGLLKPSEPQK